jgi:hypothetical protein
VTMSDFPLTLSIISAVSCSFEVSLAARTTVAPCLANAILIALPIPLLAPVTMAILSVNFPVIIVYRLRLPPDSWSVIPWSVLPRLVLLVSSVSSALALAVSN